MENDKILTLAALGGAVASAAAAILILSEQEEEEVKPIRVRSIWTSEWLRKRDEDGVFAKLLPELRTGDHNEQKLFASFVRMWKDDFDHILKIIGPTIEKQNTTMRTPIRPGARLALTLHFLATGNSFRSLQFLFRIPQCTITTIVPEVLDAIYDALAATYLKVIYFFVAFQFTALLFGFLQVPSSAADWEAIEKKFNDLWNFPNCIGAIDGKHVVMVAPPHSGSIFYNYKGSHSIVLMAICDAEYKFTYIDVGVNGRVSDGGTFGKCTFAAALENGQLDLPPSKPLPGLEVEVPHVFIADDAFALKPNIMKPFPGRNLLPSKRITNYRFSRARRCIENTFGILSARFRVLRSPIHLDAAKTRKIVKACCALHNFLSIQNKKMYVPTNMADRIAEDGSIDEGEWRRDGLLNNLLAIEPETPHAISNDAKMIREEFEKYFNGVGAVPWQFKALYDETK